MAAPNNQVHEALEFLKKYRYVRHSTPLTLDVVRESRDLYDSRYDGLPANVNQLDDRMRNFTYGYVYDHIKRAMQHLPPAQRSSSYAIFKAFCTNAGIQEPPGETQVGYCHAFYLLVNQYPEIGQIAAPESELLRMAKRLHDFLGDGSDLLLDYDDGTPYKCWMTGNIQSWGIENAMYWEATSRMTFDRQFELAAVRVDPFLDVMLDVANNPNFTRIRMPVGTRDKIRKLHQYLETKKLTHMVIDTREQQTQQPESNDFQPQQQLGQDDLQPESVQTSIPESESSYDPDQEMYPPRPDDDSHNGIL